MKGDGKIIPNTWCNAQHLQGLERQGDVMKKERGNEGKLHYALAVVILVFSRFSL